jgi:drug/metabolite transporter (DMT)-like permease
LKEGESRHTTIYVLLGFMILLWSANFIFVKMVVMRMPVVLAACIRTSFAGLLMTPVFLWDLRRGAKPVTWDEVPNLVTMGIVGMGLNQLLFTLGVSRTSVAHAAVLMALTPLVVLLIVSVRGHEKFSIVRLAGVLIALVGVFVLQVSSARDAGASYTGDLLVFGAGLAWAIYTVMGKQLTKTRDAISVTALSYMIAAIGLAPLTIWQVSGQGFGAVTPTLWTVLLYMAVLPSVVGSLIYYYALIYMPASRVTAFLYLQPVLATLLAIPVLGEHVTGALIGGGAMVLAGVSLTERSA